MSAPSLFDFAAPHHRDDPVESVQAARRPRAWQRRQALELLARFPAGLSAHELFALGVGAQPASAGQRLIDLASIGLAVRTEQRRDTPSGGRAAVYVVTDKGRRQIEEASA